MPRSGINGKPDLRLFPHQNRWIGVGLRNLNFEFEILDAPPDQLRRWAGKRSHYYDLAGRDEKDIARRASRW